MNWIKALTTLGLSAVLAGCGGGGGRSGASGSTGGGSGGSGGGAPGVPSLTVSLSSSTVTGAAPVTVIALLKDGAKIVAVAARCCRRIGALPTRSPSAIDPI